MKKGIVLLFVTVFVFCFSMNSNAKGSSDLLKEGLLGAGAGAVGGAASGAKGGDVWKGALAGAGVNIIGGALLDTMTEKDPAPAQQQPVYQQQGYPQAQQGQYVGGAQQINPQDAYNQGYQDGFQAGYKQGYTEGIKEGMKG